MKRKDAEMFFELLDTIVNSSTEQTYVERREKLLSYASEQDEINLEEFNAWFD